MADAAVSAGAEIVFLPEYCGGLTTEGGQFRPPSEPEHTHSVLSCFRDFASRRGVWINLGSIAVSGPGGTYLNRGFMIGPSGEIVGRYDKIHLFDADPSHDMHYRESETVTAGDAAGLYDTPFGKIGHTICYDLRFPSLFRALAQNGADIICCPSAFTQTTGQAHWHVLNRARAIENGCFVVSPCAVGPIPGGGMSYGHSLVVDPWGQVLTDGSTHPGVLHAQIDLGLVAETRRRLPSLQHDRSFELVVEDARSVA